MSQFKQKVMIVDDDEAMAETVAFNLKRHGYEVAVFDKGMSALSKLDETSPCLVILDWMLPDMVGPEICQVIRSRSYEVPILMLTGRTSPQDVATGLLSGADDYLSKPFSSVELLARVQALIRRTRKITGAQKVRLEVGSLVLDEESRRVTSGGKPIELSPKEFALLKVLMTHAGKTLSTESLLNEVWGRDFQGDAKTVAVHIRWLRQKLEEDAKHPKLLETVQRSGYRLNPEN